MITTKTYTILELLALAQENDTVEVLRFVNKLADQAIKEEADEIRAMEDEAADRGSMMDQYPEEFI